MAIEAFDTDAFDTDAFSADAFLFSDAGVVVPDVVGLSQAQGTSDLEAELFVVAVITAHSSVVPAGDIISQSPLAGTEQASGSTVTIAVSLGDAPASEDTSGGWVAFLESGRRLQDKRKKRQQELEESDKQIPSPVDAEIAVLLHAQEQQEESKKELTRLHEWVDRYAKQIKSDVGTKRVSKALQIAQDERSLVAYEQLQREIEQVQEEEEYLLTLLLM